MGGAALAGTTISPNEVKAPLSREDLWVTGVLCGLCQSPLSQRAQNILIDLSITVIIDPITLLICLGRDLLVDLSITIIIDPVTA